MKHHIIVKWNETVADKQAIIAPIRELYNGCSAIDGVRGAQLIENCIDRANRFDLMIVVEMDKDALPVWDSSDVHKRWKAEYSDRIAAKTIFDCE